eukprot:CAMPEP_0115351960 /NCGR_PEP_ID=MMETSP0270-20121206/97258_1 /TAXON_ID=71861 /ORGANISM="Scrippsiella trochoidea, Strain CCMP3099" /LENGTH=101 /DNA_ID=CAMNT_0002774115 /DNA_START=61 /DNA_END=366 /DNA_ORIENTATION=+
MLRISSSRSTLPTSEQRFSLLALLVASLALFVALLLCPEPPQTLLPTQTSGSALVALPHVDDSARDDVVAALMAEAEDGDVDAAAAAKAITSGQFMWAVAL